MASSRQVRFQRAVYEKVKEVPPGALTTYGDVARALGLHNYSRHVGFALSKVKDDTPWWRCINSKGQVSFRPNDIIGRGIRGSPFKSRQRMLLEQEGHVFSKSSTISGFHRKLHNFIKSENT